jgi:type IV pilus assembly protein PilO
VVLVALACLAYELMIKPANKSLAEQKSRMDEKMAKLSEFKTATAATEGLTKQLEELEEAIVFFESKLPPTSEIDKVLRDVTVIGEEQGLKAKTIKTLQHKDNSGYIEQPLRMELVGNFNSFYSFLLELEKLPRIMKIRELELRKQVNGEGQITTSFIVGIFFQNSTS